MKLTLSVYPSDCEGFGLNFTPNIEDCQVTTIIDSGAQCCLWGWQDCRAVGFTTHRNFNAVSKLNISIYGAVILRMTGFSYSGVKFTCAVIVYVSPDVSVCYLSREEMVQLQIVNTDFSSVGSVFPASVCILESPDQRNLSLPCIPENIEHMKQWLFDRYNGSTFNTCSHQILPDMEGPPVAIHVDQQSKPVASYTPTQIPLHWQDQVEIGLKPDVAMGVIEPIPHGEPSIWCHRMVITRKHGVLL